MFGLIHKKKQQENVSEESSHPIAQFRNGMDFLFDRFLNNWMAPFHSEENRWGFEVFEENDQIVVRAEMPGFESDEIDVQVQGRQLVIRAEKHEEGDEDGNGFRSQRVARSMTLPEEADLEKIDAIYRRGILEIRLPVREKAKGRRIEVKA